MRGGMYNDALCGDSNGFNKNEMQVSKFDKNDPSLTNVWVPGPDTARSRPIDS